MTTDTQGVYRAVNEPDVMEIKRSYDGVFYDAFMLSPSSLKSPALSHTHTAPNHPESHRLDKHHGVCVQKL